MMPVNLPQEEVVNVCLSEVLDAILGTSGSAVPEKRTAGGHRRFDVRIDYKGIEFIIEASYDRKDAIDDARRRIETGLIETVAIALWYNPEEYVSTMHPEGIKGILQDVSHQMRVFSQGIDISGSLLKYTRGKVQTAKEVTTDWVAAKVEELPQLLDSVVEVLVKEDLFASLTQEIDRKTNDFIEHTGEAGRKAPELNEKVVRGLHEVLFSSSREDAKISEVPEEVIVAHAYISLLMATVLHASVGPMHSLDSLNEHLSRSKNHPLLAMKEAFADILEIDYEPVFDVAAAVVDILFGLQTFALVVDDLRELIEISQQIVVNKAVLRRDFVGHIFHKVTGNVATRKGYATFFTKAPIAYFLAALALRSPNRCWGELFNGPDPRLLEQGFSVCDFACGSGTLLSAAYAALQALYQGKCYDEGTQPDLKAFHKLSLEECVWGFDALEHAAQISSVVLSLHEPGVPLKGMRIYHVPIDRNGSLGSLNFWWASRQLVPIEKRDIDSITEEEVTVPSYDLVIMNPPFSRATAPGTTDSRPRIFDFVTSKEAFRRLWKAYRRLVRDIESHERLTKPIDTYYSDCVGKGKVFLKRNVDSLYAGAALPFFFLADRQLKPGGRIALVLPRTTMESSSFFLLRAALLSGYHVEYIISSSEEGNPNFSYSTQFSEVLLIARKAVRGEDLSQSDTYFVDFTRQPNDILSGILMSRELIRRLPSCGSRGVVKAQFAEAEVRTVSRALMEEYAWNLSPILDSTPCVEKMLEHIAEGSLFGIPVKFRRFMDIPDFTSTNPRRFRGKQFSSMYDLSTKGAFRILKATGKEIINRLSLDPSKTVSISPKSAEAAEFYTEMGGRLLIPEAIRFNTTPLVSTWSPEVLVSSRAHMLRASPEMERAMCAWMNSSFAIALLRLLFTTLEQRFGHIYGWHIRTLRTPDLTDPVMVRELDAVFERYSGMKWPSLPDQYSTTRNPTAMRLQYDLDILRSLAIAAGVHFDEKEAVKSLVPLHMEISEML